MTRNNLNKVVLVSTGISRREFPFLPNFMYVPSPGIYYIAAILKENGFETSIVDQANHNLPNDEISSRIIEEEPDIVLFNQFCTNRDRIKSIVSELPEKYIIGIGNHDATFHSRSLSNKEFIEQYSHASFVWQGEAENGLVEFLRNFKRGKYPLRIDNIANRVNDLDTLPFLKHDEYGGEAGFIVTSRGCKQSGCDFCTTPQFYRDGWRARSVGHVEEELENLKSSGKRFIFVFDDNFLGFSERDLERGVRIIEKCKALDMKVFIMTTVTQIARADELGYLSALSDALVLAFLGVENGNEQALKKLGKRCNTSQHRQLSERAIDGLYRNNISTYLGYINFNPESTLDELADSALFLYENNMQASNFHNLYNKVELYDGTKLLEIYRKNKLYNITWDNGAYKYEFADRRVGYLSNCLSMFVLDQMYLLDFLNYEASNLIYMNQLLESETGKLFMKTRRDINKNNYNFFIKAVDICRDRESLGPLLEIMGDVKEKIKKSIMAYKSLIPRILINADYIIQEPLRYIDEISF
jgi:hypothetical protein